MIMSPISGRKMDGQPSLTSLSRLLNVSSLSTCDDLLIDPSPFPFVCSPRKGQKGGGVQNNKNA
jgi:hypothetical protein